MIELFDTHCHIQSSDQQSDVFEASTHRLWQKANFPSGDDIVERAVQAGVQSLVCVGCNLSDSQLAVAFVQGRPHCWASVGLHPHEAQRYAGKSEVLQAYAELVKMPKVVAIGECGLDYFYEHSPRKAQQEVLRFQIELALQYNKPLIFHVREAFDDFWSIFEDYDDIRGIVHSFTDSQAHLERAVGHNLYIGVNGIATFTKNPEQLAMYQAIPLQNLVLETDAPFLTPTPQRGNICEPYHINLVANFLQQLRNESLEIVAEATSANAKRLFNI